MPAKFTGGFRDMSVNEKTILSEGSVDKQLLSQTEAGGLFS